MCFYIFLECDEEQFTCRNGLCRPQFFVCDRSNDCGDNSDEEHCGEFSTNSVQNLHFSSDADLVTLLKRKSI